jgi:hypothetical protein
VGLWFFSPCADTCDTLFRYVFFETADSESAFEIYHQLPDAVVGIAIDIHQERTFNTDSCHLRIYKPVSIATVLKILETPIRQPKQDHKLCAVSCFMKTMSVGMSPVGLITSTLSKRQCEENSSKPIIRPFDAIKSVKLGKDAFIHDKIPVRLNQIKTSIRLHCTVLESGVEDDFGQAMATTAIQLLKIAGSQEHENGIFDAESKSVEEYDHDTYGLPYCVYRRGHSHWHLGVFLSLPVMFSFADQVRGAKYASAKSLMLIHLQLDTLSESMPEILQNRMSLSIVDVKEAAEVRLLLSRLQAIYAPRITTTAQLLPWYPPGNPDILFVRSVAAGSISFRSPAPIEDDQTIQRRVVPPPKLVAPCSGALVAEIKGDNVDVVVEFTDEKALV